MDREPIYYGLELDAETALALLHWQAELGADEPILDESVNRFDLAARAPVPAPESQLSAPSLPVVAQDDADQNHMVAQAEALANSAETLAGLAEKQEAFDGIELKKGARNFCFSDGNPNGRVLILGEAPGDEEDRQGRPFVGRAGQLLDRMFAAIGLSREAVDAEKAFYIMNILTWHPPGNRDPNPNEIALSLPFVRRHIELADPELIVLMGNIACESMLGRRGILRLRGNWQQILDRPAMPMTHPAYLLRNPAAKRDSWSDLLAISARLDKV